MCQDALGARGTQLSSPPSVLQSASPGRALLPLCPAPTGSGLCMPHPDPARAYAQAAGRLEAVLGWRWGGESLVELWFQGQRSKQLRTRHQARRGQEAGLCVSGGSKATSSPPPVHGPVTHWISVTKNNYKIIKNFKKATVEHLIPSLRPFWVQSPDHRPMMPALLPRPLRSSKYQSLGLLEGSTH